MKEIARGRVEVSPTAIATLARQVVLECYGVIDMAGKDLATDIRYLWPFDPHHRGVVVHLDDDEIVLDLYVVIEYGTRIITVARNIQSAVKYTVERSLRAPVVAVNVHVQDLRVSAD